MDSRNEIRDFLTSRRARITPERAGLPAFGGHRRVPGLRREEVALLAGISVDYYTRLERGNARGVSGNVLEALARALQLDDDERAHLFDLTRAVSAPARPCHRPEPRVRPSVRRIIDAMATAPAYVCNGRMDILAANQLGHAVFAPVFAHPGRPANLARFMFLDPAAPAFYPEWDRVAGDTVALLRAAAGRDPYDRTLCELVGELSTRSEPFRTRWAAHDVRILCSGIKRMHHPVVGDLALAFESMELAADPGLRLNVYTAEGGSPSEDGLNLLASWAATPRERPAGQAVDQA